MILWDLIGIRSKRTRIIKLEENEGSIRRCLKALKNSRTKKSTDKPKKRATKPRGTNNQNSKNNRSRKCINRKKKVRTKKPKEVPMSKGARTTKFSLRD